ncbi:unnamed protein product [Litomosoides sigmodontis]|uniref:C2H2-type domain-containing protein n=1 Tax=Litomosoides sigmodontis TaxID=42156 RepID=A0A3P6U4L2_LITSI|nr:unnamed protein product [Litomosoides sigmodontis]
MRQLKQSLLSVTLLSYHFFNVFMLQSCVAQITISNEGEVRTHAEVIRDDEARTAAGGTEEACDESLKRELNVKNFTNSRHHRIYKKRSIRNITCNICCKQFKRPDYLKVHERIHKGRRDYVCNLCDRNFTQSSHLRRHQNTHSVEKNYKCEMCNKLFARSDTLNIHIKSHSKRENAKRNAYDNLSVCAEMRMKPKRTYVRARSLKYNECDRRKSLVQQCGTMYASEIFHLMVKPIADDILGTDKLIKEIISAAKLSWVDVVMT